MRSSATHKIGKGTKSRTKSRFVSESMGTKSWNKELDPVHFVQMGPVSK